MSWILWGIITLHLSSGHPYREAWLMSEFNSSHECEAARMITDPTKRLVCLPLGEDPYKIIPTDSND